MSNIKLGIAPIGWTNDDMPELGGENTFEQCISEIALAGYEGTEVGGKFPKDPIKLKKALDLRKLEIASKWFGSTLCEDSFEKNKDAFTKELDYLETLGASRINVCEMTGNLFAQQVSMFGENKPVATREQWERLCSGLNKLGEIANKRGFELCYHHHMATIVQTVDETKRLLEDTDERHVHLCFDSGHFRFSEEDPIRAANLFKRRVKHIHFKDIREEKMTIAIKEGYPFRKAVREGCFTVPGDGMIDFSELVKIFIEDGYKGWIIVEAEQDPNIANPFEYALKAKKYLAEIF